MANRTHRKQDAHLPDSASFEPPATHLSTPRWTVGLFFLVSSAIANAKPPINFNEAVRPILADNCYACHGPDAASRKAGLRLDTRGGALAELKRGRHAIVPGQSDESELIARVSTDDDLFRMPPPSTKKQLTPEQVDTLRRWIDEGAEWPQHWAFVPPHKPEVPTSEGSWARNAIDPFIERRWRKAGLGKKPEDSRERLIRRVSLDLTGIPPTPDEIDAFIADESNDAYERLVDRLLASPRYGERMAMNWLDAARYADTNGYHYDNERHMWAWRDWVIRAFNRHMPFDQFTVEQLAGDLLPNATLDQKIATGFNRNHPITWEGGTIPEEFRTEYVVDRVNTTATVWMGLTVGCARCHDHKFDPISQREFYQLFAFFNQVPEQGIDGQQGNSMPNLPVPSQEQRLTRQSLDEQIDLMEAELISPNEKLDAAQAEWERSTASALSEQWQILKPFRFHSREGATLTREADGSIYASGELANQDVYELVTFTNATDIQAVRLEAMSDKRLPHAGPGRAAHANFLLSEFEVEVAPLDRLEESKRVRFIAAHADYSQKNFHVSRTLDGNPVTGWAIEHEVKGSDRTAVFVPEQPIGFEGGTALSIRLRFESNYVQHVMGRIRLSITRDPGLAESLAPSRLGSWRVIGPFEAPRGAVAFATEYGPEQPEGTGRDHGNLLWTPQPDLIDGKAHPLATGIGATYLHRTIEAPNARSMTFALGSDDAIKVWVNGELVLANDVQRGVAPDQEQVTTDLKAGTNHLLIKIVNYVGAVGFYFDRRFDNAIDPPLGVITSLARKPETRSEPQRHALRNYFRGRDSEEWRKRHAHLVQLRSDKKELDKNIRTVMVMAESAEQRETKMLKRGRYDAPGERVGAAVPAVLPQLPAEAKADRLALARWLIDEKHPLTARVTMNRLWQMHFGTGLVETSEDFGTRGAAPSHPELLDWLAVTFIESGWDLQAMQKLMLTSATYRQMTARSQISVEKDPGNRYLSSGPRFRMPAEMIRDMALSASGLLVEKIGGPSVKPYQPAGLWREIGDGVLPGNFYEPDSGESLYRRSLYTFWKRALPPPSMATFDAPTRETCCIRRPRTNTPLQALVLMNDPTFVEAARVMAERVLREAAASDPARITLVFRLATARQPSTKEVEVVRSVLEQVRRDFTDDPEGATKLINVGSKAPDPSFDAPMLAAWTTVTSMILNLDETITK